MKYLKKLLIAALLLPCIANAQSRHPIDTLTSRDSLFQVVIFDDKSWSYLQPDSLYVCLDSNDVDFFSKDWNENTLSSFHLTIEELADDIIIDFDSLGTFCCPYVGKISSHYGIRKGRRHTGTDLTLNYGVPIYAAFEGKVRASMYNTGYGNIVIIRHANGMETYYGHLSSRIVREGDWVQAGDIIGMGGNTGRSTGPHLHFETRYLGFPFDPCRIIDFENGRLLASKFDLNKIYFDKDSKYIDGGNNAADRLVEVKDSTGVTTKVMPTPPPKPQKVYYKVKSGDNLTRIANKYHTTVGQLCKLNGISKDATLQIGKTLRVK